MLSIPARWWIAGRALPRRFHLVIRTIGMLDLRPAGLGVLLFAVWASGAHAAPPELVRDLATRSVSPQGSVPNSFEAVDNRVVFVASEPGSGAEIWGSDGTEAGTRLLADVCPGPCGSGPQLLGRTGTLTFWIASPAGLGEPAQLWRSDGTLEGTWPLPSPEHPLRLNRQVGRLGDFLKYPAAVHRGALYLGACGDDVGDEDACGLWRTDGTSVGTVLVTGPPAFDEAVSIGRALIFRRGDALWKTDGTPEGTALLAGFETVPRGLTAAGRRAFFVAPDEGDELWVTDGTSAGTRPVTNFPGLRPFGVGLQLKIKALGNRLYVVANDRAHGREVWRSDGTPAGTRRITNLPNPDPFPLVNAAHLVAEAGNRIVVQAADLQGRLKLWSVQGNGATVAIEIRRDGAGYLASSALFATGGRVLFPATTELLGQELWSTDGTLKGTKLVRDFCPGTCGAEISLFWPVPRGAAFVAREGTLGPWQVWTSDGTPGGTLRESDFVQRGGAYQHTGIVEAGGLLFFAGRRTRDIRDTELWVAEDGHSRLVENIASDSASSTPHALTAVGNQLVFATSEGADGGPGLWKTQGTAASTTQVVDGAEVPSPICPLGVCGAVTLPGAGGLFFLDGQDRKLRWTDVISGNTADLLALPPGRAISRGLIGHQGQAFFTVGPGFELWRSDGTPEGTIPLVQLGDLWNAGPLLSFGSTPQGLVFGIGRLSGEGEIWITDGTPAGTRQVVTLPSPWRPSWRPFVTGPGGALYFLAWANSQGGTSLWTTDGTAAGTRMVQAWDVLEILDLAPLGEHLVFQAAAEEEELSGLWRTDGTPEGTVPFREMSFPTRNVPLHPGIRIKGLTLFGGRLYFAAEGGSEGFELWSTDGTAEGTRLVRDIHPAGSSSPEAFTVAGGRLYFSAYDPAHGIELWESDGTTAGTRLVHDLAPGLLSSLPQELTAVEDRLYFRADDGVHGTELWTVAP
jgi:ELWxxDGT repeat protein